MAALRHPLLREGFIPPLVQGQDKALLLSSLRDTIAAGMPHTHHPEPVGNDAHKAHCLRGSSLRRTER